MVLTLVDFHILEMKSISSKRLAVLDEALEWIDTPYQHQAMVKGEDGGVDCAMLIAGVALNTGLVSREGMSLVPNYPAEWHLHNNYPLLTPLLESFGCTKKSVERMHVGDILVFKLGNTESHLAILYHDNYMIHAYGGRSVNRVTMNGLTGKWLRRLTSVYKFPGL